MAAMEHEPERTDGAEVEVPVHTVAPGSAPSAEPAAGPSAPPLPGPTDAHAQGAGASTAPAWPAAAVSGDEDDDSQSSNRLHATVGLLIGAAVIVAVLLGIFAQRSGGPTTLEPGKPVPGEHQAAALFAGVPQHGFTLGDAHAPVRLVAFMDLQCTACATFTKQELPKLASEYVRPGTLSMTLRPLDFIGHDSLLAARMAAALGAQHRLWQFVYLMFRNQGPENNSYVTDTYLSALATAIPGARLAPALVAQESPQVRSELAQAQAQAQRLHVTATPTFMIAGAGGKLQPIAASQILEESAFGATVERLLRRR